MARRTAIAMLVATAAATSVVAGCGNARTKPPNVTTPTAPGGFDPRSFATFGFGVDTPHTWHTATGDPPLVLTSQSGAATIAIWRYPRNEPRLPRSHAALVRALHALLVAVHAKDPTFALAHGRVAPVAHRGGLEIVGTETIDGQRRQVRSTHLFVRRAEVVIDEYAPPDLFPSVDRTVFLPVVYSLRVGRVA